MGINGSSTKLFAGVGLAVLAVPRLGNVRLRLHFLRRGTSGSFEPVSPNAPQTAKFNHTLTPNTTYKIEFEADWKNVACLSGSTS